MVFRVIVAMYGKFGSSTPMISIFQMSCTNSHLTQHELLITVKVDTQKVHFLLGATESNTTVSSCALNKVLSSCEEYLYNVP